MTLGSRAQGMVDDTHRRAEDRLRAELTRPPEPPLEATRTFLMTYCADSDSMEEVEALVRRVGESSIRTLVFGLRGIEDLLATPPSDPDVIRRMITWEAALALDDTSEEGANAYLRSLAEMLRRVLSDLRRHRENIPD